MVRSLHTKVYIASLLVSAIIHYLQYSDSRKLQAELQKYHHNRQKCDLQNSANYKLLVTCNLRYSTAIKDIIKESLTLKTPLTEEKQNEFIKFQQYLRSLSQKRSQKTSKLSIQPRYSCPEVYKGTTVFEFPYIKGFDRENCSRPSTYDSTTIILYFPVTSGNRLKLTLHNSLLLFRHVIVILYETDREMTKQLNNEKLLPRKRIEIIFVHSSKLNLNIGAIRDHGTALNDAVKLVKSPYVLIAPHIGRLQTNLDVERLIHVQETANAAIVGGAVKDIYTGKWYRGCYQSQLKLYTLKYTAGYYRSQKECLFCDHVVGPFITKKDLLTKHTFRKLNDGVFRDLFIRLKVEDENVLSCPDVMFYTKIIKQTETNLVHFAHLWDIRRIIEADNSILWFGFRTGLNHTKTVDFHIIAHPNRPECGLYSSLSVTPDCRYNLVDAIAYVLDTCRENNVFCELEEGTLLGATKFNHILPWERDADITFLTREFHNLIKLDVAFKKRGFRMQIVEDPVKCSPADITCGCVYVYAYGWTIEMYGKHNFTESHGIMKPTAPYTTIKVGNRWMRSPENPGLYVRNRYGIGAYKHAEHWRAGKKKHGFLAYDSGKFPQCITPGHHSCLDQFDADGNIQFLGWL